MSGLFTNADVSVDHVRWGWKKKNHLCPWLRELLMGHERLVSRVRTLAAILTLMRTWSELFLGRLKMKS